MAGRQQNGGQAFPVPGIPPGTLSDGRVIPSTPSIEGMSLRAYLAGQVLAGGMVDASNAPVTIAKEVLEIVDAMLDELARTGWDA
ncbi:MAG: hypothetical protein OXG79_12690 [Chloroflexi bacterium]|nr:hypothetical protein [Chloroflexota bacterium]